MKAGVRGVAGGVPGRRDVRVRSALAASAAMVCLGMAAMPAIAGTSRSMLTVSATILPQPCSSTNTDPNCIVVKRSVIPTPPGNGTPGAKGKSAVTTATALSAGTTLVTYYY